MFLDLTAQAPVQLGSNYPGRAIQIQLNHQLINPQLQHLIDSIRLSIGVSTAVFDSFFLPLIHRFIDYVQLIPSVPQSQLGSLLLEGLVRVEYGMHHWVEGRRSQDIMFLYAGFSAALLLDIDKIFQLYQVNLLDKRGDLIGCWNPFSGPMTSDAIYYVLVPNYRDSFEFKSSIAHVLAKHLMGHSIYEALSDDRSLYYEWLALLSQSNTANGVFAQLLGLFKDPDLLEKIKAALEEACFDPVFLEGYDNEIGLAFLNWLREQIDEGKLVANQQDSDIHLVEQGVFIDSSILVRFLRESAARYGFLQLYYQFMGLMGISRSEINGGQFAEIVLENPSEDSKFKKSTWLSGAKVNGGNPIKKEGIIIKNVSVISYLLQSSNRSVFVQSVAVKRKDFIIDVPSLKSKESAATSK